MRIITSNQGRYKYQVRQASFEQTAGHFKYATSREAIASIFRAQNGSAVELQWVKVFTYSNRRSPLGLWDACIHHSGTLQIGCRHFNKTVTRFLKKWSLGC